jgi:hypothetical protein
MYTANTLPGTSTDNVVSSKLGELHSELTSSTSSYSQGRASIFFFSVSTSILYQQ